MRVPRPSFGAPPATPQWDDFVHTAHMAFATEFLPVGLWPTAPKGARGARGGGDGCGRDDYSLALTVSSADVFVTASQARRQRSAADTIYLTARGCCSVGLCAAA